jgi:hypothetical protein
MKIIIRSIIINAAGIKKIIVDDIFMAQPSKAFPT